MHAQGDEGVSPAPLQGMRPVLSQDARCKCCASEGRAVQMLRTRQRAAVDALVGEGPLQPLASGLHSGEEGY